MATCTESVARARPTRRNVLGTLLLTLLADEVVSASTLEADGWDEHVLTEADFEGMGPAIVDIVGHAQASNLTADFKYDVVLQYRGPLGGWITASTALVNPTTTTDYQIGAVFNDRSKLGLRIRIVLRTCVKTGGTKTQRANLFVSAAVRLYQGS